MPLVSASIRLPLAPLLLAATSLLAGCDLGALGIDTPAKVAERRDAEGRAIGAACRHAGRAIEDCYALNRRADKAAIFAGWREMNDYMRENQIEAVAPQLTAPGTAAGDGTERAERGKREPS
ncbi:hypothetical protein [Azohydromonas sediminis]|uniref:hypothetical protein n=1 Tax=Azohydromonas sediminis TaxID=2259674 RepID=UPI001B3560D2|nr:hypothetical protein [Azohydromonas sediminis]